MGEPTTAMAAEMHEQPEVVSRLVDRQHHSPVARAPAEGYAGILMIARGSSDHAALFGRYVLELATRRPVALAAPSLATRYDSRTQLTGWLAVAVSQSGSTPEIVDTLEAAAAGGAATCAVTNVADSPLAEIADATLWLDAGLEQAVPATKTFTAQVAAFALLAEQLGDPPWRHADWAAVVDAMATTLADVEEIGAEAERLADARQLLSLARGVTYAVAEEAALKLAETTGRPAVGMSTADLLHGPIAATGPGVHALCFAAPGPCLGDVRTVVERLDARDVPLTTVLPADQEPPVGVTLTVPAGLPEALLILPFAVRAQQLAHALATTLGRDPDNPPALSKVTPTQ